MYRRAMSVIVLCASVALVASCEPDIGSGSYFCGPEMFCAPHLACNPNTFSCESPGLFGAFECPAGSELSEPNDDTDNAEELGKLECGINPAVMKRCIAPGGAGDEDVYRFEIENNCTGNPRLDVALQFPVGLVPLEISLIDENGAEVLPAEPCTPDVNVTGMDTVCIEGLPPTGTYFLRVRAASDSDCDGDCRHNQYLLRVRYPLT